MDNGIILIDKNLNWQNGYINVSGLIVNSTASRFAIVEMQEGETVKIGTGSRNITIIGSTTSNNLSVGDTVSVIQKTGSTNQYEEHIYTAFSQIKLVLCINYSNYNISFFKKMNQEINDYYLKNENIKELFIGHFNTENAVILTNNSYLSITFACNKDWKYIIRRSIGNRFNVFYSSSFPEASMEVSIAYDGSANNKNEIEINPPSGINYITVVLHNGTVGSIDYDSIIESFYAAKKLAVNSFVRDEVQNTANCIGIPVSKILHWYPGYISTSGVITKSTLSSYAIVEMQEGEIVKIGTNNNNITIIGSTTSDSLSVGDTITVIQKTGNTDNYEECTYVATQNIKLVLCIKNNNYNISFFKESELSSIISKKQNSICTNLIGDDINTLYPISNIPVGSYLTISTSDGNSLSKTCTINFYDEYGNLIDLWNFIADRGNYRVLGPATEAYSNVAYVSITGSKPMVPLMLNYGSHKLDYVEYYASNTYLTRELFKQTQNLNVLHIEDKNTVDILMHHTTANSSGPVKNDLTLLWVSDIHYQPTRTERMVKLLNTWSDNYFDIVINTGDTVNTVYTEGTEWYDEIIENSNIPILNTVGNHDAWTDLITHELTTSKNVYDMIIEPVTEHTTIQQPDNASVDGLNYYYKDVNNIRIIVLDCMYWDESQLSWFINTLSSAIVNDYPVIACVHYPFSSNYRTLLDSIWNIGDLNISGYKFDISAAEAVQTFMNNGGKFICWLQGHSHLDRIYTLNDYGSQLCLQTTSFTNRETEVEKNSNITAYNYDALTVLSVDNIDKIFKLYRIGADINRYGQKHKCFIYDYENKQVIGEW